MIKYVGLSVQIHGLNDPTTETIRGRVEGLLREQLDHLSRSDIEVEVEEFAGTPEP